MADEPVAFDAKPRGGSNAAKVERAVAELRQMETRALVMQQQLGTFARDARQLIVDLRSLLPEKQAPETATEQLPGVERDG